MGAVRQDRDEDREDPAAVLQAVLSDNMEPLQRRYILKL